MGSKKTFDRKSALKKLILSLLTPREVWKLRDHYLSSDDTIMALSQRSGCPPVLLYSILTPLYTKTAIKLQMLRMESKVYLLLKKGYRISEVARMLGTTEQTVREYSDYQYDDSVVVKRAWYNDSSPKPPDPDDVQYDETDLPTTSRLGWTDNQLSDIPKERKGRCPTCGHLVWLPCHACRVREDMKNHKLPTAKEYKDTDDDDFREPELFFV